MYGVAIRIASLIHFISFLASLPVFMHSTNECNKCGVTFAEYHCPKCNIWMALNKHPFHCEECGFCRVGGRANFRHCAQCCMCISTNVYHTHNCMKDKYKNNCPVCREDMFSSRQSPQDLPCGHAIHARELCSSAFTVHLLFISSANSFFTHRVNRLLPKLGRV